MRVGYLMLELLEVTGFFCFLLFVLNIFESAQAGVGAERGNRGFSVGFVLVAASLMQGSDSRTVRL